MVRTRRLLSIIICCIALLWGLEYIIGSKYRTDVTVQHSTARVHTIENTGSKTNTITDREHDTKVKEKIALNRKTKNVVQSNALINVTKLISGKGKNSKRSTQNIIIATNYTTKHLKSNIDAVKPVFRSKMILDDIPLEMGFQPDLEVEFPTAESDTPRIPHNVHQIWIRVSDSSSTSDMAVPDMFVKYMETFPKFNPDWTYYFWTYNTSRKLLQDRHPDLLHFFDNTTETVVRADLMRYVVLYEFGGLYADLDTTCLRPLDIVTKKYTCILVLAPFENAAMMLNGPYQICNGEIFCRARHPFLRYVLNTIANKADAGKGAFVIGPSFFTGQYRLYNNISKEDAYRIDIFADTGTPYFYKGERPVTDEDGIYIANTRYFLDQPHPTLRGGIKKRCSNQTNESSVRKRMCAVVEKRGFDRGPGNFTFLTHAYSFSFSATAQKQNRTYIPLKNVISKYTYYDSQTGSIKTVMR